MQLGRKSGGKMLKRHCLGKKRQIEKSGLKDFILMSEVKLNERQDVKVVLGPTTAHFSCPKANKTSTLYKTTVF